MYQSQKFKNIICECILSLYFTYKHKVRKVYFKNPRIIKLNSL